MQQPQPGSDRPRPGERASGPQWILIANAGSARIFQRGSSPLTLIPVCDFEDTSAAPAAPAAPDPAGTVRFARRIGRRLDEGLAAGQFDGLCLVAPEPILGMLKRELSSGVGSRTVLELNEDLSHVGIAEMGRRVMKAETARHRCPADAGSLAGDLKIKDQLAVAPCGD